MQVIIIILILWYLCEKIDIIRHNRKVKRYKQYQLEQKQLAAQEKERKKAEALAIRQAEKERKDFERIRKAEIKADIEARAREQAESDIYFYIEQKALYKDMLVDMENRLNTEKLKLKYDKELNEKVAGAISEKEMTRRQKEVDKLSRSVAALKNKIHSIEVKQGKAYYTAGA